MGPNRMVGCSATPGGPAPRVVAAVRPRNNNAPAWGDSGTPAEPGPGSGKPGRPKAAAPGLLRDEWPGAHK
jgi:hypothetical protein